jgi:hypothetical protein
MATLTAGALAGLWACVDDDVAILSGVAVMAFEAGVADDHASADARAQGPEDHAREMAAGAGPVFAVGSGGGVVGKGHLVAAVFRHTVPNGKAIEARHVARVVEHAGLQVLRAGSAQAHTSELAGGDACEVAERGDHATEPTSHVFRAAIDVAWLGVVGHGAAAIVHDASFDIRATEVDADIERPRRLGG